MAEQTSRTCNLDNFGTLHPRNETQRALHHEIIVDDTTYVELPLSNNTKAISLVESLSSDVSSVDPQLQEGHSRLLGLGYQVLHQCIGDLRAMMLCQHIKL